MIRGWDTTKSPPLKKFQRTDFVARDLESEEVGGGEGSRGLTDRPMGGAALILPFPSHLQSSSPNPSDRSAGGHTHKSHRRTSWAPSSPPPLSVSIPCSPHDNHPPMPQLIRHQEHFDRGNPKPSPPHPTRANTPFHSNACQATHYYPALDIITPYSNPFIPRLATDPRPPSDNRPPAARSAAARSPQPATAASRLQPPASSLQPAVCSMQPEPTVRALSKTGVAPPGERAPAPEHGLRSTHPRAPAPPLRARRDLAAHDSDTHTWVACARPRVPHPPGEN
jgi:hypothetical protein